MLDQSTSVSIIVCLPPLPLSSSDLARAGRMSSPYLCVLSPSPPQLWCSPPSPVAMAVLVVLAVALAWAEAAATPMAVVTALEVASVLAVAEALEVASALLGAAVPPSNTAPPHPPAGKATSTEGLPLALGPTLSQGLFFSCMALSSGCFFSPVSDFSWSLG